MNNMNHGSNNSHGYGQSQHGQNQSANLPVYTEESIASLRYMIEEEKMAGDLYDAFYEQTGMKVFSNIALSEDKHMGALVKQAYFAGIDVSDLISLPAGEYTNPVLQNLYADLFKAGSLSSDAALATGQQIEQVDIADLTEAMTSASGTSLVGIYGNLQAASVNHLAAFDYWLSV